MSPNADASLARRSGTGKAACGTAGADDEAAVITTASRSGRRIRLILRDQLPTPNFQLPTGVGSWSLGVDLTLPGQHLGERVEAFGPVLFEPARGVTIAQLGVLHGDDALRASLRHEADRHDAPVLAVEAHRLRRTGRTDLADPAIEPPPADARIRPGLEQRGYRHIESAGLVRLVSAVPALTDGAQALDALIPHGDRLGPPAVDLVFRAHER